MLAKVFEGEGGEMFSSARYTTNAQPVIVFDLLLLLKPEFGVLLFNEDSLRSPAENNTGISSPFFLAELPDSHEAFIVRSIGLFCQVP